MSSTINLKYLSREHVILLNKISKEIKNDFNKLTEEILNSTDKSIDWLVNSTLSRHPYLSDIYLNCCYLALIKHLLDKKENIKKIIIPNKELKKVLIEYLTEQNKNIDIKVINAFNIKKIKNKLRPIWNLIKFINLWSLKDLQRRNNIPYDREITLIDTFFLSSMFQHGKYKDRYYNGLLEHLSEKEKKSIYFLPTILINKNLNNICDIAEAAKENFIFKHDFLTISDYLFALFSPLRIKRINFNQFKFLDFNVGALLEHDFRKNLWNSSSLSGILNYRFMKRLKENNIKLRLVIDWFENQVIDRGFNKGIKDFFPSTYCVGYQGFIVSVDYHFYLKPTEYEYANNLLPNEIAVIGKGLVEDIKINKELKVSVAPAFRYSGVWEHFEINNISNKKIILVALPISLQESIEIIRLLIKLFKIAKFKEIKFEIKPHPSNIDIIKPSKDWPKEFELINGDFNNCVQKATMLIANTSSTCVETLAKGIPVIIIGSQTGLTQNPIPDSIRKEIWKLCYTPEELIEAINFYLNQTVEERLHYQEIGQKIREEYFEPVTKENVRKFLRL